MSQNKRSPLTVATHNSKLVTYDQQEDKTPTTLHNGGKQKTLFLVNFPFKTGRFHQPTLRTVFRDPVVAAVLFRSNHLCILAVWDYILVSAKQHLLLSNRPQVATFRLTGQKHSDLCAGLIQGWRAAG